MRCISNRELKDEVVECDICKPVDGISNRELKGEEEGARKPGDKTRHASQIEN